MEENTAVATVKEPKAAVPFIEGRGLVPKDFDGMYRLAQIMAASGLMPKGLERPESAFVALQLGFELGMTPMQSIQNIAVINKRPVVWGDTMLALVRQSGLMVSFEEREEGEGEGLRCTCIVKRKGDEKHIARTFSIKKAKTAGLMGKDSWRSYPDRMCQMRARSWALRDGFPDVLKGIRSPADTDDGDTIDVTPQKAAPEPKRDPVPAPDYGGKPQAADGVAEEAVEEPVEAVAATVYQPDHTARDSGPNRHLCGQCGRQVDGESELVDGLCVQCVVDAKAKAEADAKAPEVKSYEERLDRAIWKNMRGGSPEKGTGYAGWVFSVKAVIDAAVADNWANLGALKFKWTSLYPDTPWPWDPQAEEVDETEAKRQHLTDRERHLREEAEKIPEPALNGNGDYAAKMEARQLRATVANLDRKYLLPAMKNKGVEGTIGNLTIDQCIVIIDEVSELKSLDETYGGAKRVDRVSVVQVAEVIGKP